MNAVSRYRPWLLVAFVLALLAGLSSSGHAELSSKDLMDGLLRKYESAAHGWQAPIHAVAATYFWRLAWISLAVTLLFRLFHSDLNDLFVELVRWILTTGFFFWALEHGSEYARAIIDTLWQLGGQSSGLGKGVSVSLIADLGFQIYSKAISQLSVFNVAASVMVAVCGLLCLVFAAFMTANLIMLLVSAWVVSYAGVILLAFGGAHWVRDIAIQYFRTVLGLGMALFVTELIIGIGVAFIQNLIGLLGDANNAGEMAMVVFAMIVLCLLSDRLPGLVSGIAGGGYQHGVGTWGMGTGMRWAGAAAGLAAGIGVGVASGGIGAAQALGAAVQAGRAAAGNSGDGGAGGNGSGGAQAVPGVTLAHGGGNPSAGGSGSPISQSGRFAGGALGSIPRGLGGMAARRISAAGRNTMPGRLASTIEAQTARRYTPRAAPQQAASPDAQRGFDPDNQT